MRSQSTKTLPLILSSLFLIFSETLGFLVKKPTTYTSTPKNIECLIQLRAVQNDTDIIINEDASETMMMYASSANVKYGVIGATQLHPQVRKVAEFPVLHDAFLANTHPQESQEELGRGKFIMSDWRKAWHTYGQCDRSLTHEEYKRIKREVGFVVDPLTGEANYDIDEIEGELPSNLVGVLYRNGPGKFGINGERVAHFMDADGLVLRFEFKPPEEVSSGSRIKFTSRFVETEGFCEERKAQQFTKRGTFGTAPRGLSSIFGKPSRKGLNKDPEGKPPVLALMAANAFSADIKNTANTQVIAFGGKVLSLWEAGMPYRLDPITLKTEGLDSLGMPDTCAGKPPVKYIPGLPKEFQPDILGGKAHTAHPKVCPRTGHLVGWTWALNPTIGSIEVTVTEYESDGFRVVASETHELEGCGSAPHDMILTENYVVLKINALKLDTLAVLSGAMGPAECLELDGRASVRAFVFPRPILSPDKKKRFTPFVVEDIDACFSIHFSHGYEDEKSGNIVSYFCGWPPNDDSQSFLGVWGGFCPDVSIISPSIYWRMEIDPAIKKCVDLRVCPGAENMGSELVIVHPNFQTKDAKFAYILSSNAIGDSSPAMGYAKLRLDGTANVQPNLKAGEKNEEVDVYWVGSRRFAGEPLVVPKRNADLEREEGAYLLGLVYDAVKDQSALFVFDLERDLKEGPVCTIWLKTALPNGLHGCFAPDPSVKTSFFC